MPLAESILLLLILFLLSLLSFFSDTGLVVPVLLLLLVFDGPGRGWSAFFILASSSPSLFSAIGS